MYYYVDYKKCKALLDSLRNRRAITCGIFTVHCTDRIVSPSVDTKPSGSNVETFTFNHK